MENELPPSLQPTPADRATMAKLEAERQAIMSEVEKTTGSRVKVNTQTYDSVTYGLDGTVVARTINGVPQQDRLQRAVNAAQSSANADVMRMEADLQRLVDQRDEIKGYKQDGSPDYVRHESDRKLLDKRITKLRLGIVNQKMFNDARWRKEVADTARQVDEDRITAADLAKELQARGRVQRAPSW